MSDATGERGRGERGRVSAPCAEHGALTQPRSSRRKRLLSLLPLVVLLVGIGVWYVVLRDDTLDDRTRMQGEWTMSMPGRDNIATIHVEGDRWTYASPMQQTVARIVLNPAANPKEIDLILLGPDEQPLIYTRGEKTEVRQRGIYVFDGDTLRVTLSPYPDPRPKDFAATDAPVWELTRAKK